MCYNVGMRLQIAKGYTATLSRRDKDALTPERLAVCVLLQLYLPDDSDHHASYVANRYSCDTLIRRMIDGHDKPFPPVDNVHQQTLRALAPAAKTLNLYLSTYKAPDVALSLVRGEDDLFRVSHPRMRRIATPPRDGVLAWWSDIAPAPEHTFGIPLKFRRVLAGGRATQQMIEEVETSYELQRQLRNCVALQRCLASVDLGSNVTVWNSKKLGKAVFSVVENSETVGDLSACTFKGLRIRANAKCKGKFRVRIVGDVPADALDLGNQPRYFGTEIKGVAHDTLMDPETFGLVRDILMLQVCPFVGVCSDERTALTYALHYDGEVCDPAYLQTIKLRIEQIPYFVPREEKYRPAPNVELLTCLKDALLEPNTREATCWANRSALLKSIFGKFFNFGKEGWQGVVDLYAEVGIPFHAEQVEEILARK